MAGRPSGPARAGRGRGGAFAALLAGAAAEPELARGLAGAYADLPVDARRRLVDAVVADARSCGLAPAHVLVHLLAVEEDAEVARAIAELVCADREAALEPSTGDEGLLAGDDGCGAAALLQPLHGDLVELLAVRWEDGAVCRAVFEPVLRRHEVGERLAALDLGGLRPVAPQRATEALALPLWRHLRAGHPAPAGVERFARLF